MVGTKNRVRNSVVECQHSFLMMARPQACHSGSLSLSFLTCAMIVTVSDTGFQYPVKQCMCRYFVHCKAPCKCEILLFMLLGSCITSRPLWWTSYMEFLVLENASWGNAGNTWFFTLCLLTQWCDLKTLIKVKPAFRWSFQKKCFFGLFFGLFFSGSPCRAVERNIVLINVLASCHFYFWLFPLRTGLLTNFYYSISHWIFISLCSCSNWGSSAWISIKVNGNFVLLSHCWKMVNSCFDCYLQNTTLGTWGCSCGGET